MQSRHTNLPKDIQTQLNIKYDEIEKKKIQKKEIDIYIKQLREANDIVKIQKMISCIGISLQNSKSIKKTKFEPSESIPYLIELARKQISPQLTIEITQILTTVEFLTEIVENGGIQLFAELLRSKVKDVQNNAIYGLQIISRRSTAYRNKILYSEVLEIILKAQISDSQRKFDCLSQLCRCYPYPQYQAIKRCIEYFCQAILNNDSQINIQGLKALNQLEIKIVEKEVLAKFILGQNILNRLFFLIEHDTLLDHDALALTVEALKILVRIVIGGLYGIEQVIQAGFIIKVHQLFQYNNNQVTEYVFQILSIIAKENRQFMQMVLNIQSIFDQLLIGAETYSWRIQKQVAEVLTNMVSNCDMQDIQFLMEKGLFRIYKTSLGGYGDLSLLQVVQRGIIQVLEKGNQLSENYYLTELKQLDLDKLIYKCQQYFPSEHNMRIYKELAKQL